MRPHARPPLLASAAALVLVASVAGGPVAGPRAPVLAPTVALAATGEGWQSDDCTHWVDDGAGARSDEADHLYEMTPGGRRACVTCGHVEDTVYGVFPERGGADERLVARTYNALLNRLDSFDVSDLGLKPSDVAYTYGTSSLTGEYALTYRVVGHSLFSTLALVGRPSVSFELADDGSISRVLMRRADGSSSYSPYTWKNASIKKIISATGEVSSLCAGRDETRRAIVIHDWVSAHVDYGMSSVGSDFAYGALVNGRAVCAGYADAYKLLCELNGIECLRVNAATPSQQHAWNLVRLGGYWFHVDACWDGSFAGTVGHTFLLLNDDEMRAAQDGSHGSAWLDGGYPAARGAHFANRYWEGQTTALTDAQLEQDPALTVDGTTPDPEPEPEPVAWQATGVDAPACALRGRRLSFSAVVSDAPEAGLAYNYVWSRNGSWKRGQWDSTVNGTKAMTSEVTGSFVPSQTGRYDLYVDVEDASGRRVTVSMRVSVWDATGVSSVAKVKVGKRVAWRAVVSGSVPGATYNYVWSYKGSWKNGNWGSTVKSTKRRTTATSGSFTPRKRGTYYLYVDVVDKLGNTRTVKRALRVV